MKPLVFLALMAPKNEGRPFKSGLDRLLITNAHRNKLAAATYKLAARVARATAIPSTLPHPAIGTICRCSLPLFTWSPPSSVVRRKRQRCSDGACIVLILTIALTVTLAARYKRHFRPLHVQIRAFFWRFSLIGLLFFSFDLQPESKWTQKDYIEF